VDPATWLAIHFANIEYFSLKFVSFVFLPMIYVIFDPIDVIFEIWRNNIKFGEI